MRMRDDEFVEFVKTRTGSLRRTAFLLCGDWHRAEDLVQTALVKAFRAWSRVRPGDEDGYVRKVLVRVAIDDSRRFWHREKAAEELPEVVLAAADTDNSMDVRGALAALPARQRAAVVLRYWEDLSVEEAGRLMGCKPGTVKSQCAKGLAALRRTLVPLEEN
jgi:RNA polymerase sigma-70 factor (sigma-E family)